MPAQRIDVRHALFTGVLCLPTALASPATICAILLACCVLAAARDSRERRPWTFVTCSHAALCLTRPPTAHSLHTQHIPYSNPKAMFYV